MKAADIMTHRVVSVDPGLPVSEVARLMLSHNVSAVFVIEAGGRLIGVISEGDLMRRTELDTERRRPWWLRMLAGDAVLAGDYLKSHGIKARDVMSQRLVTASEDTPVADIVERLEEHRIKRVPVVRDHKVVGVVSRADILRAFAARAGEQPDLSTEDRAIRERLLAELKRQPWWHGTENDVLVVDGTVHLWGRAESPEQRKAIHAAAEGTAGVRGVKNHINVARRMVLFTG